MVDELSLHWIRLVCFGCFGVGARVDCFDGDDDVMVMVILLDVWMEHVESLCICRLLLRLNVESL